MGPRIARLLRTATRLVSLVLLAAALSGAAPALRAPEPEVVAEASAIVRSMKESDKGPYSRIVWYCNDGTVQPPVPFACKDRGGGLQHAEYSSARRRLAELGWPVGTIFAAMTWEELWDPDRRQLRLRQIPIERYLIEVDDGWVLRRARWYRGRVQIEDEERIGRQLLVRLLSQQDWAKTDFLLAREVARAIPHHGGEDRTRSMRRLAEDLARLRPDFQRLRIKLHTSPEAADAAAVRAWAETAKAAGADPGAGVVADSLATAIDALFSPDQRLRRLHAHGRTLAASATDRDLAKRLDGIGSEAAQDRIDRLAQALRETRERIEGAGDGARALTLLDLSRELESQLLADASERLTSERLTRRELVALALALTDATYGVGLFSAGERDAIHAALEPHSGARKVSSGEWLALARTLRRAGPWSLGAVRWTFAEPLVAWSALEPAAARFPDDLVRGSPALPLGEVVRAIVADAEELSGTPHSVLGKPATGLIGLNPGVAVGRLRVVGAASPSALDPTEIVLLLETLSELPPVAGILTLAEGNLLSHLQILARNLGIPNAVLSPRLRPVAEKAAGDSVMLAVSSTGSVVLERWSAVPVPIRESILDRARLPAEKVEAPRPDLSVRDPIRLGDLHGGLSGRVVGPKAANLGDLAKTFPGRVAPAVALPFGVFAEHVADGPDSPKQLLERAFAASRTGQLDDTGLAAAVEEARRTIAATPLSPDSRRRLVAAMRAEFGEDSVGVFVRSDTNVEDLPGFTGAGLNETVPHVVGTDAQLAAIARVWASPFRERPVAWRARLLTHPEDVYTSVLLMKSVPAHKSGVMVTANLVDGGNGLTVATAWGVGGAVDNESAETLVLGRDRGRTLVNEAKAPYCRRLRASGGIEWVAAPAGPVLTDDECRQLRELARTVERSFEPVVGTDGVSRPWDIEFGFVVGELTLFQIRPLVERGRDAAERVVDSVAGRRHGGKPVVDLSRVVELQDSRGTHP